jgi:hypothetical protein
MLENEAEARLFLRYQSESRSAFHRSYAQLLKTFERGERAGNVERAGCENSTRAADGRGSSIVEGQTESKTASLNELLHSPRDDEAPAELSVDRDVCEDSAEVSRSQVSSETEKHAGTSGSLSNSTWSPSEERPTVARDTPTPAAVENDVVVSISSPRPPIAPQNDESPNEPNFTPAADPVALVGPVEVVNSSSPNEANPGCVADPVGNEGAPEVLRDRNRSDTVECGAAEVEATQLPQVRTLREGVLARRVRDRARRARAAAAIASAVLGSPAQPGSDRRDSIQQELDAEAKDPDAWPEARLGRRLVQVIGVAASRPKAVHSSEPALQCVS